MQCILLLMHEINSFLLLAEMKKVALSVETLRSRSRYHQQNVTSLSNVVSPGSSLLSRQTQTLTSLRRADMRNNSPENAARARALIFGFRAFGVEEDPNFIFAQRILRAIGYFKVENAPLTATLLQLHTNYTFLMDAKAVASFCAIVQRLQVKEKQRIFDLLQGRVEQVTDDLTAQECGVVLRSFSKSRVSSRISNSALTFVDDLDGDAMAEVLLSAGVGTDLEMFADQIVGWFDGPSFTLSDVSSATRLLASCGSAVPRCTIVSLLAVVQRRFFDDLCTDDVVNLLEMLKNTSFRHERMALRLASKICQCRSPGAATSAARCLSHFYIANQDVFDALAAIVTAKEVTAMAECFHRVGLPATVLFGRPLGELCSNLVQLQTSSLMQIWAATATLNHLDEHVEKNIGCVVDELNRRGERLLGLNVSVLSSSKVLQSKIAVAA